MTAKTFTKTYNARERLFLLIKLILWRSRCRRRRLRRSANENVAGELAGVELLHRDRLQV